MLYNMHVCITKGTALNGVCDRNVGTDSKGAGPADQPPTPTPKAIRR